MYFRCYDVSINDPEGKTTPTTVAVRGDALHALRAAMKYNGIDPRYGRRGAFDTVTIKFRHGIVAIDTKNPWKERK